MVYIGDYSEENVWNAPYKEGVLLHQVDALHAETQPRRSLMFVVKKSIVEKPIDSLNVNIVRSLMIPKPKSGSVSARAIVWLSGGFVNSCFKIASNNNFAISVY